MLRNNLDQINVEEKEKYIYWKMFNRMWNMIKINLARVGEGTPGVFYL